MHIYHADQYMIQMVGVSADQLIQLWLGVGDSGLDHYHDIMNINFGGLILCFKIRGS